MKKSFYFLCLIITIMFVGMINVKAIDLTFSSYAINVGKTVNLAISGVINGNTYALDFEENYFDVNSSTCGNRTSITADCQLVLMVKSTLSLTEPKDVTFTISEVAQNDETKTKTIKINANKTTTSPTTTTKAQTTTTQAPKSSNANLKTLEIKGNDDSDVILTPNFSSDVYEYSATVDASIKTININATMEDSKSNMVISNNATDELKAGENNKITITVTAEDGTTKKAYVINIKREALTADATLKSLLIKECSDFAFKSDKFSYTIKVKETVSKLTIDYVTSSEDALVSISGNEDLKDGSKVKILVTAEDGTKKEYILNIKKESKTVKENTSNINIEKNPLIIMALSMVAFGLIGGIVYVIKK